MDNETKDKLIETWIQLQKMPHDSEGYNEAFWAHEMLWDIGQDSPDECLQIIVEILKQDNSDLICQNLAAGPLEDLLAAHGELLLEEIKKQAKADNDFSKLLGGVWQNNMPDNVWNVIKSLVKTTW